MYPVELKIQPNAWRVFAARKADPKFSAFSEKVFRRDNYVCQFCGFQAMDYQEILNLDHNYYNNKTPNMVTACCFCTQCFFLDTVGVSYGGGTLVYLPELAQTELNSLCHVLFCAITNDTGYRVTAQQIYRNLKLRSKAVDEQFGEGSCEPFVFVQLIMDTQEGNLEIVKDLLTNIRLLPARSRFKTQIETWAASALKDLTSEDKV